MHNIHVNNNMIFNECDCENEKYEISKERTIIDLRHYKNMHYYKETKILECRNYLFDHIPIIPDFEKLYCYNCPLLVTIPKILGLLELNCWNCPLIETIPLISGLKRLSCYECPLIKHIPIIHGLLELECWSCPSLTCIESIPGLLKLDLWHCTSLRYIDHNPELLKLSCYICPLLLSIPLCKDSRLEKLYCYDCPLLVFKTEILIERIERLQKLYCSDCPLIIEIPKFTGLKHLDCRNCLSLRVIPMLINLEVLFCSHCPLIKEIPLFRRLKKLDCSNCRSLTNLPSRYWSFVRTEKLQYEKMDLFDCSECKWLNIQNKEYQNNIKKLIFLQKWIRRILLSKKIITLIPCIIPLYYHPDAKGGYYHKKKLMQFLINI